MFLLPSQVWPQNLKFGILDTQNIGVEGYWEVSEYYKKSLFDENFVVYKNAMNKHQRVTLFSDENLVTTLMVEESLRRIDWHEKSVSTWSNDQCLLNFSGIKSGPKVDFCKSYGITESTEILLPFRNNFYISSKSNIFTNSHSLEHIYRSCCIEVITVLH